MTDFLKIAKSIAFHFAHICAYGVETVKYVGILPLYTEDLYTEGVNITYPQRYAV